jgi:hypothetical protein
MQQNNVDRVAAAAPSVKAFNRAVSDLKKGIESSTWATTAATAGCSDNTVDEMRELSVFNKDTLTAFTQANQIFVAGSQDLFQQATEAGQTAFAETLSGFRGLASVKTVKDGLELQASLVEASFRWMSESIRLAQASLELAKKASAPLTARASHTAKKPTAHAA